MTYKLDDSLLHLLHRASQAADDGFAGQAKIGEMTARQFVVLSAIGAKEGSSQTAISDVTGIDRSTLADVIGRLQRKGLVARRRTKQDARAYAVRLTEAGQRQLSSGLAVAMAVDERLIAGIAPSKRAEFLRHLRLVVDGYSSPDDARKLVGA